MHNALKGFLGVWGAIIVGVVGLIALDDGPEASPEPEAFVANVSPISADTVDGSPPESTARFGATMLEQAIFDAFPISTPATAVERKKASNASDFVAATINSAGHLCAKPVEMQQAAPGQYGIGCITNRSGSGRTIYLLDSRTGNVDPIS